MTDILNIGLIGVGSLSQIAHIPVLEKEPRARIVGVCDTNAAKAERIAESHVIPCTAGSLDELMDTTDCDAVIIATPTRYHFPLAKKALERGVNVFLEMPPVMNVQEAEELRDLANTKDRVISMIRHRRYRADSRTLKTIIEGGELGELQYILLRYHFPRGWFHDSWRGQLSLSGGGILMDQGVQLLDLGLFLAGEERVASVSSAIFSIQGADELDEAALVLFRLDNGVVIAMELGPWLGVDQGSGLKVQVFGSGGMAKLPGLEIQKELYGNPVRVLPRVTTPERELFQRSYKDTLRILLTGIREKPDTLAGDPEKIVSRMKIAEEMYRSAREGIERRLM